MIRNGTGDWNKPAKGVTPRDGRNPTLSRVVETELAACSPFLGPVIMGVRGAVVQ